MKKIVVTGGNRGIGLEICKQLVNLGHYVVLTSRDEVKGRQAAEQIGAQFQLLDVSNTSSIEAFIAELNKNHSFWDVLINNAGIFLSGHASKIDFNDVNASMETNVYGPWRLMIGLLPLLEKSKDGRIINISSGMGSTQDMNGSYAAYRMSKLALNGLTQMLAQEMLNRVRINAMCPGWVQTDMGGAGATRTVEKGAETAVWLANAKEIPTGKFFRDKQEIEW